MCTCKWLATWWECPSSWSQNLTEHRKIGFVFRDSSKVKLMNPVPLKSQHYYLALLLISLASDVSINPGPVAPPSLSVRDFTRFRGLKVSHLNIRSVYPKLDSLKLWLLNQSLDVFTVSETWLKPSITDFTKQAVVLWPMFLIELDPILAPLYLNLVPSKSLERNARNWLSEQSTEHLI